MAWFGDGLPSLSNLKGQLTNFTKEVLSEGIVEEIDERSKALKEANQKCIELQEILNSKDAENDNNQDDEGEVFFWDPPSAKNRNSKNQNHVRQLQEQLVQATMKIRDLEAEVKRIQKVNNSSLKDELTDGHQKAEFLRAKQDMVNRIIQMEEKSREAERNTKRMQSDETALINDFRTVLSKLNSLEKLDLVRGALKALETENEKYSEANKQEKSDFDEKFKRPSTVTHESVPLKPNFSVNSENHVRHDGFIEASSNREMELYKKIEELQEENKRLFTSVEELDQQHEESIEKLLSLKEEVEKKHQCLQNAYEQLYVDYNQAQDKVVQLEGKLKESSTSMRTETVPCFVQTNSLEYVDKCIQTRNDRERTEESEGTIEARDKRIDLSELTKRVKDILKSSFVEIEPDESIFETLAKEYIDVKWKKDVVEKWVSELNRELKGIVEMKDDLQMECNIKQTHIDTLLQEIEDLKLNLPPIPEANEERVVSLESEIESLNEEVKHLQAENSVLRKKNSLRKKNAVIRGVGPNETRLKGQGGAATASQARKQGKLENIPEDIEDTFNTMESLNRKLNVTLDENDELRRKIDLLEGTEKEMREQLRMSLDRCKDLDENIELIEELKRDLENTRRELRTCTSNGRQLENTLAEIRGEKDEIQKENEELSRRNEQLEMEISQWRESNSEAGGNDTLRDLQERLNRTDREKDDLEYDILNMRKELDEAFNRIDGKEDCIVRLSQENESLTKEKNSLLEQLTAIQDDSNDKIDLVSTEKSLLEQEMSELKERATSKEKMLSEIREELREAEERYAKLESDYFSMNKTAEKFQLENENLQNEIKKHEELKNNEFEINKLTEKLSSMQSDHAQLMNEVETLRLRERELAKLQENFATVTEESKTLKSEYEAIRDNYKKLEYDVACLQEEKKELLNRINENAYDNEKQQIAACLEEERRQNDALKNENSKLIAEITDVRKKMQDTIEGYKESIDMGKQTIESLSHLIKEKDEEINDLKNALHLAKNSEETSDHFSTVKNERDELVKLVTVKHNESLQYHGEIQRLTQLLNEQTSQIQSLLAEKDIHLSDLKEKDAQLLWTNNELQAVQQRLRNAEDSSNGAATCGIVEHSKQTSEIEILSEKCNALEAALIQEQSNNRMLQNQLGESQSKEANAAKELERLRSHLVEMESNYTEDALLAEEGRKELEAKLQQAEEKLKTSSNAYTSANIRANQQVETLQQQMVLIVQQRDDIQNKLSVAEDKILSQTASLTNLQIVLEQFQQDKEKDIIAATERIQSKLNESYKKREELTNDVTNLKEQLAEAKECLQAASRLSEQLDKKTERIEQLSQEVDRLTNLVNTADQRIEEAKQSGEGKVDKTLIKNLLLGYLSSSAADKSSVLRVFSTILDFNETEKDKAGLNNTIGQNSWFSRLNSGSTVPNKNQEASLSAAFIRFLENESKPKPQLPALPIQTPPLPRPGHSRQHSTSSTQSTSLLSNVNLPTFPDFIPARNTGSILKEVLKDS
ncbi:thyroid receptor-interacting protein 11 isoform X2 [Apis mellifera]|uniref:Thyroid receptor-interacting protein 11 isoform X2 n=1 Tax=Apis mellifera TaxID=7460 RepID=A0A7M7MWW2_APIME|nr:thyroid receptor-interacting protein 11 isoform X2 [Apis mellifera]|eukprot:XP_026302180.1 thyroid receptor-interacting protein 11 isoform X2 [Apis mellifera]